MLPRLHRTAYILRTFSWVAHLHRLRDLDQATIDRPIFLLGTQGGGLTLLSRMLRRHSSVISAAGNHRYWTAADELQNVYGPVLPFELTGLRYKAPPHPTLSAPRSWTYAARDLYPLYRKRAEDASPKLRKALHRVIRFSALQHASDPQRCRFLDKSQSFCVRMGLLAKLLEGTNPRFVVVPRDPYVSVYRAAIGGAGDMKRLLKLLSYEERIDICAEHYGNSMRAILEDARELKLDLHVLPFEQLLAAPECSLRAVCHHVALDYSEDMLPASHHRLPLGSRFLDRWYPIRPEVNQRYEALLDKTSIDAVNRHCHDILEPLGYRTRG